MSFVSEYLYLRKTIYDIVFFIKLHFFAHDKVAIPVLYCFMFCQIQHLHITCVVCVFHCSWI